MRVRKLTDEEQREVGQLQADERAGKEATGRLYHYLESLRKKYFGRSGGFDKFRFDDTGTYITQHNSMD